jgi:hypothetical protein
MNLALFGYLLIAIKLSLYSRRLSLYQYNKVLIIGTSFLTDKSISVIGL